MFITYSIQRNSTGVHATMQTIMLVKKIIGRPWELQILVLMTLHKVLHINNMLFQNIRVIFMLNNVWNCGIKMYFWFIKWKKKPTSYEVILTLYNFKRRSISFYAYCFLHFSHLLWYQLSLRVYLYKYSIHIKQLIHPSDEVPDLAVFLLQAALTNVRDTRQYIKQGMYT